LPLELLHYELLLPAFALVLARIGGLVMGVPMLASEQVPGIVKIWLVVTLSLMTFPAVAPLLPDSLTLGQVAAGMVGEFIVGEVIGLGASAIFLAAQVAGKAVSHQSGLALGQVFNPVLGTNATVLDQLWFFAVLMLFLALRGHMAVMDVLLTSFRQVPPMMMVVDPSLADFLVGLLRSVFATALRLGGPAILALLLTSLVMGFFTKTMPQLNVLSVGFSLKIATALLMVATTISFANEMLTDALFGALDDVGLLFEHLSKAVIHAG
jgi:flagellar biosynthetic protein FliR